jgi:signal transduction histidine kinase
VVTATSGLSALQLLKIQPVDCIILDLVMPEMDGKECCRRIREIEALKGIPILVLTGHEDRVMMLELINTGADDYIAKSSDFEVFRARVRAQIRRREFEEDNRRMQEELAKERIALLEAQAASQLAEARGLLLSELEQSNRELEQKNRQLEAANRELDAFAYSVSHDLKAPVRSIRTFSRALLDEQGLVVSPEAQATLGRIYNSSIRMGQLIDDMLMLSKTSRMELKPQLINLEKLALQVMKALKEQEPDRVVDLSVSPMMAEGDPRLLLVVFENLLGNAWKFTRKASKTEIRVGVDYTSQGPVYFVADNGVGFEMSPVDRLFRPFSRLHRSQDFEGTGIGLATIQRIIHRHQGRVWAESEVGKGSCFRFTLAPDKVV